MDSTIFGSVSLYSDITETSIESDGVSSVLLGDGSVDGVMSVLLGDGSVDGVSSVFVGDGSTDGESIILSLDNVTQ